MSQYKAVCFDIGGVICGSPLLGIQKYEKHYNIPDQYINWSIFKSGRQGAFQRVERGEISAGKEFYKLFEKDVRNPEWIPSFIERQAKKGIKVTGFNAETLSKVDGEELWDWMMREAVSVDPYMITAVQRLRKAGIKVAALTNNFKYDEPSPHGQPPIDLQKEFDYFLESSIIGLRKPDPEIFKYTMNVLDVTSDQLVFLDDIGSNLASAKSLGIKVIRVYIGKTKEAVQELSRTVGVPLLEDSKL